MPTGYIYPKPVRGLRDLVRKRIQLVQDRSREIIRLKSFIQLHTGETIRADKVKAKRFLLPSFGDLNTQLSLKSSVTIIRALTQQIKLVEKVILQQLEMSKSFANLKTIPGVGDVLAETILLETGDIKRFKGPGNFASYSRCVESRRTSNGKSKGENNRKNGNRYLAWAFIEAANFTIRYSEKAKLFYQRKAKATNGIVARKALAHKIARACYWILRKGVAYDCHSGQVLNLEFCEPSVGRLTRALQFKIQDLAPTPLIKSCQSANTWISLFIFAYSSA